MHAPTTEELAIAVALGGSAVLVGTAYADYRGVSTGADGSGGDGDSVDKKREALQPPF
ncbi:hypothetical protein [uncultured Thiodictyon sp.]|uniref:hypothetical protein n=1 Tax=uncultured Thiodictyon sp. TaxID=1846217 RepID=UPI0025E851A6|nr:hypothetical protein [uncultured Thiodictyon sp.]